MYMTKRILKRTCSWKRNFGKFVLLLLFCCFCLSRLSAQDSTLEIKLELSNIFQNINNELNNSENIMNNLKMKLETVTNELQISSESYLKAQDLLMKEQLQYQELDFMFHNLSENYHKSLTSLKIKNGIIISLGIVTLTQLLIIMLT